MDSKTRELLKAVSSCEEELMRLYSSKNRAMGGHDFAGMHHCLACDEWQAACEREGIAKQALTDYAEAEAAKPDGPQSCYPDEINTLREMIDDERKRLEALSERPPTAAMQWARAMGQRKIEALTTAIEALTTAIEAMGGAL